MSKLSIAHNFLHSNVHSEPKLHLYCFQNSFHGCGVYFDKPKSHKVRDSGNSGLLKDFPQFQMIETWLYHWLSTKRGYLRYIPSIKHNCALMIELTKQSKIELSYHNLSRITKWVITEGWFKKSTDFEKAKETRHLHA